MLPDDMISLKNCSRSAVQITFCGAVVTLDFFLFYAISFELHILCQK